MMKKKLWNILCIVVLAAIMIITLWGVIHKKNQAKDDFSDGLEKLEADKERDRQSTDPYSTQNITEDSNNLFPNLNAQNSPQEALNAQGATIPQPEQ